MAPPQREQLLDQAGLDAVLDRMAQELTQRVGSLDDLLLVGIHRRGVHLARSISERILRDSAREIATGSLDITLYRDDLKAIGPRPVVGETRLPTGGIDSRTVVIIDDVLYTGRTVRAALDELADFGRPRRILLCVLVDRGGRELPIQPDVVGQSYDVKPGQVVEVLVEALDGRSGVELVDVAPS